MPPPRTFQPQMTPEYPELPDSIVTALRRTARPTTPLVTTTGAQLRSDRELGQLVPARRDGRRVALYLQVVQPVRVGLLAEHGGAVVVGEGALDRVRVVSEVEHRDVVFLRVGLVEP